MNAKFWLTLTRCSGGFNQFFSLGCVIQMDTEGGGTVIWYPISSHSCAVAIARMGAMTSDSTVLKQKSGRQRGIAVSRERNQGGGVMMRVFIQSASEMCKRKQLAFGAFRSWKSLYPFVLVITKLKHAGTTYFWNYWCIALLCRWFARRNRA